LQCTKVHQTRGKSWKGQMKWNLNDCILGGVCWTTYFHLIAHSSGQTMLFPLGWLAKNWGRGKPQVGAWPRVGHFVLRNKVTKIFAKHFPIFRRPLLLRKCLTNIWDMGKHLCNLWAFAVFAAIKEKLL